MRSNSFEWNNIQLGSGGKKNKPRASAVCDVTHLCCQRFPALLHSSLYFSCFTTHAIIVITTHTRKSNNHPMQQEDINKGKINKKHSNTHVLHQMMLAVYRLT